MNNYIKFSFLLFLLVGFASCEPFQEEKSELGGLPNPSFTITQGDGPNDFILENTTDGGFITQWDLGSVGKVNGEYVEVNFPFMGTYEVIMTTFSRGGHASTSQMLTVNQDDPNACNGNFQLLTGCDEKVWKLAPEADAEWVGPNLNESWWGNSETDVIDRFCHFDDEYIFRANGEFEYKSNGDFWADEVNGAVWPTDLGLAIGCNSESDWPAQYSAWGSGVYNFSVTPETLTVAGDGAFIGLYKVGTSAEVATPQSSVTYKIIDLSADRMVIYADLGGSVWRFTLVAQ